MQCSASGDAAAANCARVFPELGDHRVNLTISGVSMTYICVEVAQKRVSLEGRSSTEGIDQGYSFVIRRRYTMLARGTDCGTRFSPSAHQRVNATIARPRMRYRHFSGLSN